MKPLSELQRVILVVIGFVFFGLAVLSMVPRAPAFAETTVAQYRPPSPTPNPTPTKEPDPGKLERNLFVTPTPEPTATPGADGNAVRQTNDASLAYDGYAASGEVPGLRQQGCNVHVQSVDLSRVASARLTINGSPLKRYELGEIVCDEVLIVDETGVSLGTHHFAIEKSGTFDVNSVPASPTPIPSPAASAQPRSTP